MATINQVREAGKDHRTLRVYGQEVNLTTASIARMNLFLHEIEDFDIMCRPSVPLGRGLRVIES